MGYTVTPAAVGAPITAGNYNQLVGVVAIAPIARITTTAAQSTSATINTNTVLAWNTEVFDPSTIHDNVTNNSRMTVPTGWGGIYQAISHARFNTAAGLVTLQFAVNGTPVTASANVVLGSTGPGAFPVCNSIMQLNDSDYVEVWVSCNTASVALIPANCDFSLEFIHI